MVLGFKIFNKELMKPTGFVEKILNGDKVHTLRKGKRWKAGNSIQMATGVRTKSYHQFNKHKPDLQNCVSVQTIKFKNYRFWGYMEMYQVTAFDILIDGRLLTLEEMKVLAKNDGFDSLYEFFIWFKDKKDWPDQIVHWTDLKY